MSPEKNAPSSRSKRVQPSMKISQCQVKPTHNLAILSRNEINALREKSKEIYKLFRLCALAVLNTGSETDDSHEIFENFEDFDIEIESESQGIELFLKNAPRSAFVEGVMIEGIRAHLFSVLRDILFTQVYLGKEQATTSDQISEQVFEILRHADILRAYEPPNLIVCWGGHSIPRHEYDYTKQVGYELGLRYLDIATGCGIGAMKGPMKGATIAHAKQKYHKGRYIGITEPSIIASEAPNPIVNELVILPDIEKRLEAFVRLGHCIIIFPGGVGTMEEILYLLGLLMLPENRGLNLPVLLTADQESAHYMQRIDDFLTSCFGIEVHDYYQVIIDDPAGVAQYAKKMTQKVHQTRLKNGEMFSFNWTLNIPESFQTPFIPTHEHMAKLNISSKQPLHELAANLRCAFSGIVAGNIKSQYIKAVEEKGKYKLMGDPLIMKEIDSLLQFIANEGRMKLDKDYKPCYEIVY